MRKAKMQLRYLQVRSDVYSQSIGTFSLFVPPPARQDFNCIFTFLIANHSVQVTLSIVIIIIIFPIGLSPVGAGAKGST